tara:strand:+ start:20426 stop:21373 length:948 start_codon:yes stop_codon:yes gene_type:complete
MIEWSNRALRTLSSEYTHGEKSPLPPKLRTFVWIVSFVLMQQVIASSAHAGAWTPKPGHGYTKFWVKWLPGFWYMDGAGNSTDYGTYHELFFNAYAEWGMLDGFAGWIHAPLVRNFWLEDTRNGMFGYHITPGDPALGLRLRVLKQGPFRLSIDASARAPLASGDPVQEVYSKESTPRLIALLRVGRGVWEFQGGLSFGAGWSGFYTNAQVSFIYMTGDFDSVISWNAEAGWSLPRGWQLRVRIAGWHPLGNGTAPYHDSLSGQGNGTQYIGFALETDVSLGNGWYAGLSLEGGLLLVQRQTGGPVLSPFVAKRF